jgi:hypothetical protein
VNRLSPSSNSNAGAAKILPLRALAPPPTARF